MKILKKIIVPILLVLTVFMVYTIYFSPKEGLGSFSDFDTNNNANKDIRVRIVKEKRIEKDPINQISKFYAVDKNNTEVLVHAPLDLPASIEVNDIVTLRGHLHREYFHAASVEVK